MLSLLRSLVIAVLTGLVGALVLHVVIVFAVPYFAVNDAWSRVRGLSPALGFVSASRLDETDDVDIALAPDQPFTRTVVCRFEIGSVPVHLTASGTVPFWSFGVFDRQSNEIFSMNDRTAAGARLDVTLASPMQMIGLRETVPPALSQSVLVETPAAEGYVLLRTVIPDASWDSSAEAFLESAQCGPVAGQ